jgi:hypothetical protein
MTDARPLRDRLGEAIRRARLGSIRPLWSDLDDKLREQWREHADALLISARNCGLRIEEADDG